MILDDFDSLWFFSNIFFSPPRPPPPPPCCQPHFLYSPKQKLNIPKSPLLQKKQVEGKVEPPPSPLLLLSPTPQPPCYQPHLLNSPKQKVTTPESPFLRKKQVDVMVEPYEMEGSMTTSNSTKKDKESLGFFSPPPSPSPPSPPLTVSVKKGKKSPKSSSKKRDKEKLKFNELMEFREFGFISFEDIEYYGELTPMGPKFYPYFSCKMPPFNEGMAMKEHLKSWACAVASIVR